jgi:hypothetical protein
MKMEHEQLFYFFSLSILNLQAWGNAKKKGIVMRDNNQVVDCIKLYLSMPQMNIGGVKVQLHSFLTTALDGAEW